MRIANIVIYTGGKCGSPNQALGTQTALVGLWGNEAECGPSERPKIKVLVKSDSFFNFVFCRFTPGHNNQNSWFLWRQMLTQKTQTRAWSTASHVTQNRWLSATWNSCLGHRTKPAKEVKVSYVWTDPSLGALYSLPTQMTWKQYLCNREDKVWRVLGVQLSHQCAVQWRDMASNRTLIYPDFSWS